MTSTRFLAAIAVAAATLAGPALAQEGVQDPFMLFKMKMIDKDKDGMVSKKEFMSMMDKAYDMQVRKTDARKGMTEKQMEEFLKSLFAG